MHGSIEVNGRRNRLPAGREGTRLRVVEALRRHGCASRSDLAYSTGLSRGTVASVVADLQASGLVTAGLPPAHEQVRRGRPPTLLRLGPTAGVGLALRMDGRSVDVAVADLSLSVLAEGRAGGVEEAVAETLAEAGVERDAVQGAVLAAPPAVGRRLDESSRTAAALSGALDAPVRVEADAGMAALGELAFGAARGLTDIVYVSLSSRISAGLVLGGRLHRGATGIAGELGHVQVNPDGALCRCGNRGCLETVASLGAVLGLLGSVHGPELGLGGMLELLAAGDSGTERVMNDAGRALGRVLAGVCNCLNPQAILLGGELSAAGEPLLQGIREAIGRYAQPEISALVSVRQGELGSRAPLLGALRSAVTG